MRARGILLVPSFAALIACQSDTPLVAGGSTSTSGDAPAGTTSGDPTSPGSGGDTMTPPSADSDSMDDGLAESSGGGDEDSSGGQGGRCRGAPPTTFDPNPMFAGLADSTAVDLGAYECESRLPQIADHCAKITDYSRFNYDPTNHRVLMFGGGHSATGRTDVDAFSFENLSWNSLYDSMSCEAVAAGNLDDRGFHIDSGHPVARHTYDMTVMATVAGQPQMLLLSTEGFAGHCHDYNASIQSVAALPLGEECPWEYSPQFSLPWYYAAQAEFDPISGMVIVVGSGAGASAGGMWVYDPTAQEVVAFAQVAYDGIAGNLVYFPPDEAMYLFERSGTVRRIDLQRDDWAASTSTELQPSGTPPDTGETGYAYDSHCEVIGGAVVDDTFYAFDPIANAWSSQAIASPGAGASIGTVVFHMLDYDPIDNVYLIIAAGEGGRRTWAYRYRN